MFFFFNDTATTEIYTLSLHDALPISGFSISGTVCPDNIGPSGLSDTFFGAKWTTNDPPKVGDSRGLVDRKSTRLNSSHANISYAVFCLKKKKLQFHTFSVSSLITYSP